jgi:hypothetical protein
VVDALSATQYWTLQVTNCQALSSPRFTRVFSEKPRSCVGAASQPRRSLTGQPLRPTPQPRQKVSYPNEMDVERARAHRWDPGGDIVIHGLPNVLKHEPEYYAEHNWTDGCIALSNADMAEIWRLTPDGIPIEGHDRHRSTLTQRRHFISLIALLRSQRSV